MIFQEPNQHAKGTNVWKAEASLGVLWLADSRLSAKARYSTSGYCSLNDQPNFQTKMKRAATLSGSPSGYPVVEECCSPYK